MNSITHLPKLRIPKSIAGANAPGSPSDALPAAAKNKASKRTPGQPSPLAHAAPGKTAAQRPAKGEGESTAHVPPGGGDHDDLQRRFQALKDSMPRPAGRPGGTAPPTGEGYLSRLQQKHYGHQKANASGGGDQTSQAWNFPFDDPTSHAGAHHSPGASAAAGGSVPSKAGETAGTAHAGGNRPGSASNIHSEGPKPSSESPHPPGGDTPPASEGSQGFSKRAKIIGGVALAGLALWALDKSDDSSGQSHGAVGPGGAQS